MLGQDVSAFVVVVLVESLSFALCRQLLLLLLDFLLFVLDFFETEELFSFQLVKLGDNVRQGALNLGNDDVLDGVDPAVSDLDDLVQSDERRLQRSQLDQQLYGLLVVFPAPGDLLTSSAQARQLVSVGAFSDHLELWQINSS